MRSTGSPFYAESMMVFMKQNKNEYLQGFRFQVPSGDQSDINPSARRDTGREK
jgi:hypothetical protein